MRGNLKIAALYRQITSSVALAEEDIFNEYQNRNEKVQISYVFVSPEPFKKDVSVDASRIERYYQDHKSGFLLPPMVNVQYLAFDFPEPPEAEEDLPAEKETEAPSREGQEAVLERAKDAVREKADAVFQELLINPDMTEIARRHNLTMQTSGLFSMEQPNLALGWSYDLLNRIFQMAQNEVNAPFETPSGLSIIQIKEKQGPYIPQFSEAREKAREAVMNEEAQKTAGEKTLGYLDAIMEELNKSKLRDFPKAAKALGLELHQTPVFSRGQYLPQIGISKEFQEAAFGLNDDDKISGVVETVNGFCILHLDAYVPADRDTYEKEKDALAASLLSDYKNKVFTDFLTSLRLDAELVDNISKQ